MGLGASTSSGGTGFSLKGSTHIRILLILGDFLLVEPPHMKIKKST